MIGIFIFLYSVISKFREILGKNFIYILLIPSWFALAFVFVQYAALMPNITFFVFNNNSYFVGNDTHPNTLQYKDVVGFYLSSLLTSALVIVGAANVIKLYFDHKEEFNKLFHKK
jgi:hypothetical protein